MTTIPTTNDNNRDDHVDAKILQCLDINNPKSFFLFAGAGSGKTKSLVTVLKELEGTYGEILQNNSQRIAVITYTNAACDVIKSRLYYAPLFSVSTIHSFVWELIKSHQKDMKQWVKDNLEEEIADLNDKKSRERNVTPTSLKRTKKIENKVKRLAYIEKVKQFTYNPNGDNLDRDSLNHSEIIKIGAYFINEKKLMQSILVNKYPILLIDESQDTNKHLMEAFLGVQKDHKNRFALGLFGDSMQRIYFDGKVDLVSALPSDWEKPAKLMNHRSTQRVVKLINKIKNTDVSDNIEQIPRSDKEEGYVRLFISESRNTKDVTENKAVQIMAEVTEDSKWATDECNYKQLILEHHMAATRLGFTELFEPLCAVESFKSSFLRGDLPGIRFFTHLILPIVDAHEKQDKFAIARVVRENSPFFKNKYGNIMTYDQIHSAKKAVDELLSLWTTEKTPNCLQILQCVAKNKLFEIPDILYPITNITEEDKQKFSEDDGLPDENSDISEIEKDKAWSEALNASFNQVRAYESYISGKSLFDTHQGVKGDEFDRVMVIIDDDEAGGNWFSYDQLFGTKEKSSTDIKNESEGKDTSIERTRRLFYVTCSRAKKSLAIVLYSSTPETIKEHVLKEEWFEENEIVFI